MTWLIPGWRPPGSGGGTPRIPPAAQNAFRGILRIVTPAVNLVNRLVQGVTGGRGGIAQLARGLTGLVNQAYQRATGQAWGAQGGTGGGTSGAGAGDGTGEEGTLPLPSASLLDVAESSDRLRLLNEEEEETRPFNWQEFFGDDFTLEDIGDSVRESAEWFLRFVRGEVDEELPLLTQIRTLFDEARGRLEGEVEPSPVDENWTSLTSETLDAHFGEGWIEYIAGDENEAQALITLIDYDAQDMFGIDLASDLQGLTAQEAVDMYIEHLGSLPEDPFAVRERAFWETIRNTFGVSQDVTRDLSEFAIYELGLPQTSNPTDADAAVNDLVQDYVESGLIDSEAVQGMTREQIAYAYYQATLAEIEARRAATDEQVIELTGTLSLMPRTAGLGGSIWLEGAVQDSRSPYQAELDSITQELANLRDQANEAGNLVLAFNRMYEPPQSPYTGLLLFAIGFVPIIGGAMAVGDFVGSVVSGNIPGAILSLVDILGPGNIGDMVGGAARRIDNAIDDLVNSLSGPRLATADGVSTSRGNISQFADNTNSNLPNSGGLFNFDFQTLGRSRDRLMEGAARRATNATTSEEGMTIFAESVYITRIDNSDFAEFDVVLLGDRLIIENKSAWELRDPSRNSDEDALAWAQRQIYNDTAETIEHIGEDTFGGTRIDGMNTSEIITLEQLLTIRNIHFKVDNSSPQVIDAVELQLRQLQRDFPDWTFSVTFGR